jgi:hypothetical protein
MKSIYYNWYYGFTLASTLVDIGKSTTQKFSDYDEERDYILTGQQ